MEYLIVANGSFLAKTLLLEIAKNKIIIALDGAADALRHLNIFPDIILGDFDSIRQETLDFFVSSAKKCIQIIHTKNQNYTDLAKALYYIKHLPNKPKVIHIVCATGGRMDHELANIRLLQEYYDPECPLYIHIDTQSLFFVRDQKNLFIHGQEHDYCGFFGSPHAILTVHYGLAYGNKAPYELFLGHDSIANKIIGNQGACVDIMGEALVVCSPMIKPLMS